MLSKALSQAAGAGEPTDPNWGQVSLLLHGDGTNGAQNNTFVDSSSGGTSITRNGNPTQGSFSPYYDAAGDYDPAINGGSGYFDGTDDYLQTVDTYAIGTQNFTIEAWVYCSSYSVNQQIIALDGGTTNRWQLFVASTNDLVFRYSGSGSDITYATGLTADQWEHVAVVREGTGTNQTKIYLNGTQVAQGTVATTYATDNFNIGTGRTPGASITGYLSDVRVVIGTAVYTSNFTPPTAPLTAITNTAFLCNFTNAGIFDNAMLNDFETVGNAQISTSVKKYGTGSMSFDGTGDWLTGVDSVSQQFGTESFTIEGWVYLNALGAARGFISKGTSTTGWSIGVNSSNQLVFSYTATALTGSTALSGSTWYHFAVVRNGSASGNLKIYLNGVADATSGGAVTDNFNQTSTLYIGADRVGASALNGYLDDIRITKGVARYTANFTPPTRAFPNS